MKNHGVFAVVVVALLLCLSGVVAHAQDQMESKVDVFAGYSFASHHQQNNANANLHGYGFGFVVNLSRNIGFEADFSGHNGKSTPFSNSSTTTTTTTPATPGLIPSTFSETNNADQKLFSFLFGPKITHHVGNFQLFTHLLVGGLHAKETGSGNNRSTNTFVFAGPPVTTTTNTNSNVFSNTAKGTGFGLKVGGGVDWVHGHWGVRFLQIDYLYGNASPSGTQTNTNTFTSVCTPAVPFCPVPATFTSVQVSPGPFSGNATSNDVQLSTGLVFRFW